jgi:hypothetical protein
MRITGIWLLGSVAVVAAGIFNVLLRPSPAASVAFTLALLLAYTVALFGIGAVTPSQASLVLSVVRSALRRGTAAPANPAADEHRR